jgi:hypothetical protein
MTALAIERAARVKKAGGLDFPVKAGVKIWKGAYVVLVSGFLAPASEATNLKFVGRASATVDNTSGQDGDLKCHVDFPREKTLFPFIGDSGNLFTQPNMGTAAYLLDDQTATTVSSGHSAAGTAWKIETVGGVQTVWVEADIVGPAGPSFASKLLTGVVAAGNGAAARTCAVAAVGDVVQSAVKISDGTDVSASFESTVTVAAQLQQTATNLTGVSVLVTLKRA